VWQIKPAQLASSAHFYLLTYVGCVEQFVLQSTSKCANQFGLLIYKTILDSKRVYAESFLRQLSDSTFFSYKRL